MSNSTIAGTPVQGLHETVARRRLTLDARITPAYYAGVVAMSIGSIGQSSTVEIRVRYAETDAMGYLHHAKYWEYFEHVRTELLRCNGYRYRDLEAAGTFFVVYKAACKYLSPIRYDDLVAVTATVDRITRTRVDHVYEVRLDGSVVCTASSTLACVGRDGRPILMSEELWSSVQGKA